MRPRPPAAGFQFARPGNVSRTAKSGCSADARRDTESAMPLDVSNFTKSRREVLTKCLFFLNAFASRCRTRHFIFNFYFQQNEILRIRPVMIIGAGNNERQEFAPRW
jgi:hypothetical protein